VSCRLSKKVEPENTNKDNIKIKHVAGKLHSDDLYAIIGSGKDDPNDPNNNESEESNDKDQNYDLRPGWEKHDDEQGLYFWHTKTGLTQRELPTLPRKVKKPKTVILATNSVLPKPTASVQPMKVENKSIRFAVVSLGAMEVSEEDLSSNRSQKTVERCISELKSKHNVAVRWGDVSNYLVAFLSQHEIFCMTITLSRVKHLSWN
jgi:amyloid beta A4 precursor protein-binding family B member 2